uniref:G_PROTEIN_RECEP_F1_2 domain-containing protein n=1 Tax=Caenorhabditis tropicalis TaxID=1561998 RepID=A0A1I7UWB9_9PELO
MRNFRCEVQENTSYPLYGYAQTEIFYNNNEFLLKWWFRINGFFSKLVPCVLLFVMTILLIREFRIARETKKKIEKNENSDKDTESKVARYLKSCGVITSLKTTKCVKKSDEVDKELKAFAKSKDKDLSKIKASCKETVDCIKDLKCKPLEEDHKETLDLCGRALFQDEFKECSKKLQALKKSDKDAAKCLEDFKSETKKTTKDTCTFLKGSKDCIKAHIKKECGDDKLQGWQRFAQDSFKENDCEKAIGAKWN